MIEPRSTQERGLRPGHKLTVVAAGVIDGDDLVAGMALRRYRRDRARDGRRRVEAGYDDRDEWGSFVRLRRRHRARCFGGRAAC